MDELNHQIQSWIVGYGWSGEALFAMVLAAIAGGLVGLEREVRGRQAGFRTNLLVCLGSALVMLVSRRFAAASWPHAGDFNVTVDPARIAYGVMTGIGFLGAGAILKQDGSVRGLTTAAAMWCVAAIGLAIGFEMYVTAALAVILVVAALWLLDYLEVALPARQHRRLTIRCPWRRGCVDELVQRLRELHGEPIYQGFRRTADLAMVDVDLIVTYTRDEQYHNLERQLQAEPQYQMISNERV